MFSNAQDRIAVAGRWKGWRASCLLFLRASAPPREHGTLAARAALALLWLLVALPVAATPANKAALERHFDRFLGKGLNSCTTCHLPNTIKNPESLEEFPHNRFGHRLRTLGEELLAAGKKRDIPARLELIAHEDSDSDGVANQTELLLGRNPGDAKDVPSAPEITQSKKLLAEFKQFSASYRWRPFDTVSRPNIPKIKNKRWARNPIDTFVVAEQEKHGLKPVPETSKEVLLRRVYLDLVGLAPTPEERAQFLSDRSPKAYEKLVDRLLDDPRYGERWGRHWMDIWRYSDWAGWSGGNQIRDSKPHIWRWRDWIVESLNTDKAYNQMLAEMLAADELYPEDTNALRATGFLVRNYKMLSREQWLEDTIKHTSQAFLGVTMGCAKCHDHMFDPISQAEYYRLRAVFEPHQVRTDRLPGELDTAKAGLVRAYDATNSPTFFFLRGDERRPDTNRVMKPGVPRALCGSLPSELDIQPIGLPLFAANPDRRSFVIEDSLKAAEKNARQKKEALEKLKQDPTNQIEVAALELEIAEGRLSELKAQILVEQLEMQGKTETPERQQRAAEAAQIQFRLAKSEAKLAALQAARKEKEALPDLEKAKQKLREAEAESSGGEAAESKENDKVKKAKQEVEKAEKKIEELKKKTAEADKALAELENKPLETAAYKPRKTESYPDQSTGRRAAFARWVSAEANPLTARVAMNHMWARHFERGLVPSAADFGRNGNPATHPALLDWLAAEFMARGWSMKAMHRLILTSATYRMASISHPDNSTKDPDNIYLWRMPARRMEAEIVRDNLLHVAGSLDATMGGPEIDHLEGLTSRRRSIYLRIAAEKEVEFLKIFDGPSVTECYQRRPTVLPQQALALANSKIALEQARNLAARISKDSADDNAQFIRELFLRVLSREPKPEEISLCKEFLEKEKAPDKTKTRVNLALVLFNHNEFVTIR